MKHFKVSVVIPAHNEGDGLRELEARLTPILAAYPDYEIVFVDDGSTDGTLALLRAFAARDPHVRYLSLSRNFGHQCALKAGLDRATGDCVITMDADLQHAPEHIPEMIERWQAGYEVVNMVRSDTDTPLMKRLTSRWFYRLVNALSDVDVPPGSADFRLLDRKAVSALAATGERTVFLRGLIPWLGFRQCQLPYIPDRRAHGRPKYTWRRMILLALDGITSSSIRPLHLSTFLGVATSSLAVVYAGYALAQKIVFGTAISGWTSLLIGVMLLGGVQLLMLGIIGQYLGKVLLEVKGRPTYVVREQSEPRLRSPVADLQERLRNHRALP